MDYIRTNKIKATTNNTNWYSPSQIRFGSSKKYRLYKGSTIIWDVLRTVFNVKDFTIDANGGDVAINSNVTSYGTNALGANELLDWTCSPTTIPANTSTSQKTHTITYTQSDTGETATATCTQDATVADWTVSSYATTPTVPASGGTVSVTIHWDLYLNGTYQKSGTSSPSRVWLDNVDQGTSTVSIGSAGTTLYENTHIVGYITNYEFYADDHFFNIYGQDAVYRAANTLGKKTYTQNLSLTKNESNKSFTSSGGTTKLKVTSTKSWSATWSSGSPASGSENITATISATNGIVDKTSVSGSNVEVVLTVGKSGDADRTITVTVSAEEESKSVSYTQVKRVYKSASYGTPSEGDPTHNNIPAWGGTTYLTVPWTQTKTITYDNDTTSSEEISGTAIAIVLNGTMQQYNSYITVEGGIYKNSCGTEVTSQRTVFTVTSYKFTANNKEKTVSTTYNVGQAPNKLESTTWISTYNISISADSGNIPNTGGNKTIYVTCTENGKETYTSTATKAVTRNATATLTTNSPSISRLYTTSITGTGQATLNVDENFSDQRSIVVAAKCGNYSNTTTVTQNGMTYQFDYTLSGKISQDGGIYKLYMNSYVNGKLVLPTCTESVSWVKDVTVKEIAGTVGDVEISFQVDPNTGSERNFVLHAVQPNSNKTIDVTIVQEKYQSRFSISLNSSSYFKKTGANTYQFYATIDITATKAQSVSGQWHYVAIDEDGLPLGADVVDPIGQYNIDVYVGTYTKSFTGTAIYIEGTAASGFKGIRASFVSSTTDVSFGMNIYNIK